MRRAVRIAIWTCGSVLLLTLLLAAAILIAGNTQRGRALLERETARLTDGRVQLAGLSGSFPSALELEQLQLSDAHGIWLTAQGISLKWSPLALIARHVNVATLQVAHLSIERAPLSEPSRNSNADISLPRIDVEQLWIGTLELGEQLAGVRATLSLSGTAHLRSLKDAEASLTARRIDGQEGDYELTLRFDPARMDARLKLEEPAGGALESLLAIPGLGDLSVAASLNGPRGAERIEFAARAGELRARAQGSVDLNHESAQLTWSVDAPAMTLRPGLSWQRIALNGNWHGPLTAARADGRLRIESLEVATDTRVAVIDASMSADHGDLALQARADGISLPGPQPRLFADSPLQVNAAMRLSDPQRRVQLTAEHRLFSLKAAVVTAGAPSASFNLRLPDLNAFAAVLGLSLRGWGEVRGTLSEGSGSTRVDLDANTVLADGTTLPAAMLSGPSRLRLAATLSGDSVDIQRLTLTGRTLSVSAAGNLVRGAGTGPFVQSLRAHYEAEVSNLAVISTAVNGTLQLKGSVEGPVGSLSAQSQLTASVAVRGAPRETIQASVTARGLPSQLKATLQAQGHFSGAPLQLEASLERTAGGFHVVVQHSAWKSAQLQADLTTAANLTPQGGSVRLSLDRLADLQPFLGTPIAGRISGELTFRPAERKTHARLTLDAKDLILANVPASVHLSAEGPVDALSLQLAAQSPDLKGEAARLNATAQLNLDAHTLALRAVEAHYHGQTLRLLGPAKLAFADGLAISHLKLGVQRAVIELDGRFSPALDVRASVHQVDYELVDAFVPELLAQGSVDAQAQMEGSWSAPSGQLSVKVSALRFAGAASRNLHALDARASARLDGHAAQIEAQLDAGDASQLKLTGSAPLSPAGTLDLKLEGRLDAALANPWLETKGERATGTLTVNATVTGDPASPQISGTADLAQGDLRDYTQGLYLSGITAHLIGSHGALRIVSLVAHAAQGQLTVTGTIGVLQPKIPVELQLTASNAQPITSDLLTTILDANLKLAGTLRERIDLSGTINLHRTVIGIPNALPPDVAVLDVRRPGQAPPSAPENPLIIGLDLSLHAPREILVQGRGLAAELGGDLHIGGTTASPSITGGFDMLRGTFTLSSTQLTFTDGHVSFNGAGLRNNIDPSLDFTAQATAASATVTLHISGLATAPQFTLSSTPQLPEDEILARLLFGESASQLTALQIAQIGVALASLSGVGGSGPNPLAKVQKSLGLDRLSVGSGTTNPVTGQSTGAAVEAGRYVSSRVFIGAKQSTTGYSQVEVDVDLSKHLKLQTRLGNGTAIQGTTPENDPGSTIGLMYQLEY
jgi:translocation and assembly module TamB